MSKEKTKEQTSSEKANKSIFDILSEGLKDLSASNRISECDVIATEEDVKDYNDCHSSKYCPDQYVGKITAEWDKDKKAQEMFQREKLFDDNKNGKICLNPAVENKLKKDGNILLLILESPHQHEFHQSTTKEYEKGQPIGPANGPTGDNIVKYFRTIFGGKFDDYHLLLLNAINFQCSLGIAPKRAIYRDTVFSFLWNQKIFREHFKYRLRQAIAKSPKCVIINTCTEGECVDKKLWEKVEEQVDVVLDKIISSEIPYCHIGHPSCWHQQYNRYKKMIGDIPSLIFQSKDSLLQSGAISFNKAFCELLSKSK